LTLLASLASAALLALTGCTIGLRGGRDGAEANPPANLSQVPDAEPRIEVTRNGGGTSKPYTVLGKSYVPITDDRPFRENGLASWYGRKFNGQPTASGELYDMYAMTAAHKTLPLPSYVRVRNPANGREAIVRVNDRGPFHDDRVIDLSYTAAFKLDLLRGVAPVEIERITNEDIRTGAWRSGSVETPLAQRPPATAPAQVTTAPENIVMNAAVPAAMVTPVAATPGSETTEAPEASPQAGFWVQLGAFSQRDGALRFQQQIARDMPGLALSLNIFSEQGIHRLQAGPYVSRDLAQDTATQIRDGFQVSPMIIERR
jgi:rare lipoprotein A